MSERLLLELYNRVAALEDRVSRLEQEKTVQETKPAVEIKGKYRFLSDYLYNSGKNSLELTFSQIENIAKTELPASKKYREFWANTESHSIALAWLNVGYRTTAADIKKEVICFEKIRHYTPNIINQSEDAVDDNFLEDVENAVKNYEEISGVVAQKTRAMLKELGPDEALSRLLMTEDYQKGFKVLRDNGKQNISFEAIIVKHKDKFNEGIVEAAKFRLKNPYWETEK